MINGNKPHLEVLVLYVICIFPPTVPCTLELVLSAGKEALDISLFVSLSECLF